MSLPTVQEAARELRHALRGANVAGGDPALNAAIEEFSAALNEIDDDGPLEDEDDGEGLCECRRDRDACDTFEDPEAEHGGI